MNIHVQDNVRAGNTKFTQTSHAKDTYTHSTTHTASLTFVDLVFELLRISNVVRRNNLYEYSI